MNAAPLGSSLPHGGLRLDRQRVALVHGAALQQPGFAARTFRWLEAELSRAGARVDMIVPHREGPSPAGLTSYDLLWVGDLGGVYGELSWVSALASLSAPVISISHGHPFCVDGSRLCGSCPLRITCPSSDRVEVYRRLARAARQIVYHSPLHQEVSESYLGAYPDKTMVVGPVDLPLVSEADPEATRRVAFPLPHDRAEWEALAQAARCEPERALYAYGRPPAGFEPPTNLTIEPPLSAGERLQALSTAAELVLLPSRPLPFGEEAAAMLQAGRRVSLNANVGLSSYEIPPTTGVLLQSLLVASRERLLHLCSADGRRAEPPAPQAKPKSWLGPGRRVFVWAHRLGLGDSVNLLPFLHALEDNVGKQHLRVALPSAHAGLLSGTLAAHVIDERELDLDAERRTAELIIEVTIYRRDAFQGEIRDERWLQIELARQPQLFDAVHENLLSALNRAGLHVEPRRPLLVHGESARQEARARLLAVGCDPTRDLLLACHPGAGGAHKRWPSERFARLCERAYRELGAKLLLITGPDEDELALPFTKHMLHSRGEALRDVSALLSLSHGFLGNDSGLMHVACASGCPALALFGPSLDHLWGPSHPDSVVVAARDADGVRQPDVSLIDEETAFGGLLSLLRRVVTRPPRLPDALVAGSSLTRVERHRGSARYVTPRGAITVDAAGGHDPVAELLGRLPLPLHALALEARRVAPEPTSEGLLDTLFATGVLAPHWTLPDHIAARLFALDASHG